MIEVSAILEALLNVLTPYTLFFLVLGVLIGIVAGILPGINGAIGISLILPFTFGMEPATALIMMLGLWGGQNFGGGVTAALVHAPGAASGAATLFDGYPMAQKGQAGKALGIICVSSSIGWFLSTIMLAVIAIPLAAFALRFSAPEYFAVGIFGLSMVASMATKNIFKGAIATLFGLAIVTIGTDPFSGLPRFTFGRFELMDGINFLVVMIGVFAIAEVLVQVQKPNVQAKVKKFSRELPSWREIRALLPTMFRSAGIGMLVGTAPGAGGSIAAFIAYNEAKRFSRKPEEFGYGSQEGLAAPEAANNATEGGAMVPLLALGIPGSGAAAVILASMILYGLRPGPQIFTEQPVLVYSLFFGLALGAVALLILGLLLTPYLALVMRIPKPYLITGVAGIAFMAAMAITGLLFDVRLVLLFGVVGYIMRKLDFPPAPMILALVLGFMIETSLRRALIMSDGDWSIFMTRPIAATILAVAILSFLYPMLREIVGRLRQRSAKQ
ncbi:C4-dicarboxylate ABC transporter permease [Natronospirillum operosum]|uniref:C4-dicarboxylate ABC transporter permease n=1 Tax=Natronospirillum operosum TaxID=2759953 RepID=A0A4Z0WI23_9GAMM|nr:tripartite tricarboxylate transporter permease [Natronospirillum operosum]TGG94280.1 C4-dicarboxylate ABC transporter permease [Natronospirillum operosum]